MAALFSGHVLMPGNSLADGLWKAGIVMAVICVVNLLWLLAGAGLARYLQAPRAARMVNMFFAALLLMSVVFVAVG